MTDPMKCMAAVQIDRNGPWHYCELAPVHSDTMHRSGVLQWANRPRGMRLTQAEKTEIAERRV